MVLNDDGLAHIEPHPGVRSVVQPPRSVLGITAVHKVMDLNERVVCKAARHMRRLECEGEDRRLVRIDARNPNAALL